MMKRHYKLTSLPLLACLAAFPVVVTADDALEDLDGTMIVLDSPGDLDAAIAEIKKPSKRGVNDDDWEDEEGDASDGESEHDDAPDERDEPRDDHFEHDQEEREDVLERDDDFEDGDEIDDDLADDEASAE